MCVRLLHSVACMTCSITFCCFFVKPRIGAHTSDHGEMKYKRVARCGSFNFTFISIPFIRNLDDSFYKFCCLQLILVGCARVQRKTLPISFAAILLIFSILTGCSRINGIHLKYYLLAKHLITVITLRFGSRKTQN